MAKDYIYNECDTLYHKTHECDTAYFLCAARPHYEVSVKVWWYMKQGGS